MLEVAVLAARRGGDLLKEHWTEILSQGVTFKGPVDLVTEGDRRSEQQVIQTIRARFPEDAILSEEKGVTGGDNGAFRWLIDPLDGTTNYAHGLPIFAVSVGVEHEGQLQAGAVYDPIAGRLYSAARGHGAYCNGRRLQVSRIERLERSLLATGFAYDIHEAQTETNFDHLQNFARRAQAVRRVGSAALDLCWVAEGWFDGFWEFQLNLWDVAAGMLVVQEAGGVVTDFHGRPLDLRAAPTVNIVATNGSIHRAMLEVLRLGRTGMGGA